jgi:hypothetical protein
MNAFFPTTGAEADWNAAYYRLEDYFRALRVVNKVHQSQVILRILERAAAKHALDETQNPTELAMEEARQEMAQWFETILGNRERLHVTGLLAMLAADAPARWPAAFLAEEFPSDLSREMKESDIHAGPDLQVSSMVPRPIDVTPLLDGLNFSGALEKIKWGPAVAAVVLLAALSVSLFLIIQ